MDTVITLYFMWLLQVPILRGAPRKGGKDWGGLPQFTPDAELINGRLAMVRCLPKCGSGPSLQH